MMGYNHAISGATVWVAATTTVAGFGLIDVTPIGVITGAIVTAGAALLPDADHHNATIAHSVPIAGGIVAGTVGKLSGGHRHGLHSILAVVAVYFLSLLVSQLTWQPTWWHTPLFIGAIIATAAITTFALKVLKMVKTWPKAWVAGTLTATAIGLWLPSEQGWFVWAVTIGYTTHLLGDYLTVAGIAWLWPLKPKPPFETILWHKNGYFSLPLLGNAGSIREYLLGFMMASYTLIAVGVEMYTLLGI